MTINRIEYNLPEILEGQGKQSGISMVRALKQIKQLLEQMPQESEQDSDRIMASIDDVDMMLSRIKNW